MARVKPTKPKPTATTIVKLKLKPKPKTKTKTKPITKPTTRTKPRTLPKTPTKTHSKFRLTKVNSPLKKSQGKKKTVSRKKKPGISSPPTHTNVVTPYDDTKTTPPSSPTVVGKPYTSGETYDPTSPGVPTFYLDEPTSYNDLFNYDDLSLFINKLRTESRTTRPDYNDDSILADGAMLHSKTHEARRNTIFNDFLQCLRERGTYKEMLEMIIDDDHFFVPRVVKVLRVREGEASREQIQLFNKMLIDWQALTRKKYFSSQKKGLNCPYYQPSVTNQHLRTFFAMTRDRYGWN